MWYRDLTALQAVALIPAICRSRVLKMKKGRNGRRDIFCMESQPYPEEGFPPGLIKHLKEGTPDSENVVDALLKSAAAAGNRSRVFVYLSRGNVYRMLKPFIELYAGNGSYSRYYVEEDDLYVACVLNGYINTTRGASAVYTSKRVLEAIHTKCEKARMVPETIEHTVNVHYRPKPVMSIFQ